MIAALIPGFLPPRSCASCSLFVVTSLSIFISFYFGCDPHTNFRIGSPRGTTLLDMVRLQDAIEKELGVPVDVLTEFDLPAIFRDQVIQEARPL